MEAHEKLADIRPMGKANMSKFKLAFMASLGYGHMPPQQVVASFAYHNRILKGDTEQAARLSMEQITQLLARS